MKKTLRFEYILADYEINNANDTENLLNVRSSSQYIYLLMGEELRAESPMREKRQIYKENLQGEVQQEKKMPKSSLSDYLNRKVVYQKRVSGYEKEQLRRQELENLRIVRRLSEIKRKRSPLARTQEDEIQEKLLTLNMHARRMQRMQRERTLQQQNDGLVERIVRMRSYNSPNSPVPVLEYTSPQTPQRRRANRSVLLPHIDPPIYEGIQ